MIDIYIYLFISIYIGNISIMPLEMKCSLPVLVSFLFVNWTNIIFTSIRAEIFTQYDCGYHYIQYLTR